jgi:hypothetical protein
MKSNNGQTIMDDEDAFESHHANIANREYQRLRDNYGANGDFTERVMEFRREFPDIKQNLAEEIVDFVSERSWSSQSQKGSTATMIALVARMVKMFRYLKNHPGANAFYATLYVQNNDLLDDVNGMLSQSEFANKMYPTTRPVNPAKAAVNNAVKDAQKHFKLPARRDMRTTASCNAMSKSIINRLEKTK